MLHLPVLNDPKGNRVKIGLHFSVLLSFCSDRLQFESQTLINIIFVTVFVTQRWNHHSSAGTESVRAVECVQDLTGSKTNYSAVEQIV